MEFKKQIDFVKVELMKYAMCSDIVEIKKVFFQNNNNFGKNREWLLLSDIFKYSCDTMNVEILETLYEIYGNIDTSIRQDNNYEIFYKSILFENTKFYTHLLSHQGPLYVFNKNKQNIIDFTIMKRCRFIPILELLKSDEIIHHVQLIIEDAVVNYDENTLRVNDEKYVNENYVFMCFETASDAEKKNAYIPLSVKDNEYIKFLKMLIK